MQLHTQLWTNFEPGIQPRVRSLSSRNGITRSSSLRVTLGSFFAVFVCLGAFAENGQEAWLRYASMSQAQAAQYQSLPGTVVVLGDSVVLESAQKELVGG